MYKTQKRFEEASSLLAKMPWLPTAQQTSASGTAAARDTTEDGPSDSDDLPVVPLGTGLATAAAAASTNETVSSVSAKSGEEGTTPSEGVSTQASPGEDAEENGMDAGEEGESSGNVSKGGRSDASPARGAGAARVAGLNKAAAAASAAAAAAAEAEAAAAVETGAEAEARAIVERHAEAMRASMNEIVGELAVTTATRPSASQDWLDSRVIAAKDVSVLWLHGHETLSEKACTWRPLAVAPASQTALMCDAMVSIDG